MEALTEHHVQFFTAVCKDWLPLLGSKEAKELIINDLKFRCNNGGVKIGAYVIMPNHLHIIWRIGKDQKREDVQRDFLKFTAREILKYLKTNDATLYDKLLIDAKDRKYGVWKRDSMSIDLYNEKFFQQKFNYIHSNPCQPKWNLVSNPLHYKYSSASFYEDGKDEFDIITHYADI